MKEKEQQDEVELYAVSERVVRLLSARGETVSTAESCTGGLIAKSLTDIPGSSAVFPGGVVAYTNAVKSALLGVSPRIFETETEVSHACAKAMAKGAADALGTTYAISVTGYAGPGGGTERDPVGTVYLGLHSPRGTESIRFSAPAGADREAVRNAAALTALAWLERILTEA